MLVDLDLALVAQFHSDGFEPEPLGVRQASGGEHHAIDLDIVVIGHRHAQAAVLVLVNPAEVGVEAEHDALHRADLQQPVAHAFVVAAQELVRPVDQRDLGAEFVEDAGELVGDVARARNQDPLGHGIEMERLVAGDAQLMPGARGNVRPRAGAYEDDIRGLLRAVGQGDLVRAGDGGALLDDLDLVAFERLAIEPVEPVDLGEHVVAQRLPVEHAVFGGPPKGLRILQVLGKVRAVDEQFLGHAATDHAGAADAVFLGHGDARAVRRRNPAGAHPARARADGEKVVVVVGHGKLLLRARIWRLRRRLPTSARGVLYLSDTPTYIRGMFPFYVQVAAFLWLGWLVSWQVAALWRDKPTVQAPRGDYRLHFVMISLGLILMYGVIPKRQPLLWHVGPALGWSMIALTAAGIAFAWWARIALGKLWSGGIERMAEHRVVETGPYAFVRHPIYTGLIAGAVAMAGAAGETVGDRGRGPVLARLCAQGTG